MRFLRTFAAVAATILLLSACSEDPTLAEPTPTAEELGVTIVSPVNGSRIEGNVVELQVEAQGIDIVPADGDISGETGHFHVFVDQSAVATGETIQFGPGIIHFSGNTVKVPGLSIGRHTLTVVLGGGTHTRIGRSSATVEVDVAGPSIDATAPRESPMATGFAVETVLDGVLLPEDSQAGQHLDFLVNPVREPEADGRPIPSDGSHLHTSGTSHQVTGLPAGEHTVWVVLADENHVPVSPLVADRVVVEIR